jgi:hypothetical protein
MMSCSDWSAAVAAAMGLAAFEYLEDEVIWVPLQSPGGRPCSGWYATRVAVRPALL